MTTERAGKPAAFDYEHRSERLLTPAEFQRRLLGHAGVAAVLIAGALLVGVFGYHFLEQIPWIDALLNASMILGGMGPVDVLHTTAGKVFASFYALFSGIAFIATAGILFAPFTHRLLHRLHLEQANPGE